MHMDNGNLYFGKGFRERDVKKLIDEMIKHDWESFESKSMRYTKKLIWKTNQSEIISIRRFLRLPRKHTIQNAGMWVLYAPWNWYVADKWCNEVGLPRAFTDPIVL